MSGIRFNKEVELFDLEGIKCFGNFVNGSFIGLDKKGEELVDYIIKNKALPEKLTEESMMMLDALKDGGYFNEGAEECLLKSSYLHITNRCNLNCIGCYSFDCTRNTIDDLTLDDLRNIMDQLRAVGIENITISGGETLIRKDIVDILRYAKEECKFECINIITNGTIRNKDIFLQIKDYINDIAVSIDGYDDENPTFIRDNGIFNNVIGTIKLIRDLGLKVVILPTLHNKNIDNMTKYCDLAKKLRVSISFSLMTCSNDLEEYIPTEAQLLRLSSCFDGSSDYFDMKEKSIEEYNVIARKNCGAGKSIISVAADGNIYPCHMMHSEETVLGNIKEIPLVDILKSSKPLPEVKNMNKCNKCNYKDICGGGCRARAFLVKNNLNDPDPYCSMYENFYKGFVTKIKELSYEQ